MLTYRLIDSSNKIQPFILVFSCFLRKHHHVLTICQINSIDSFAREVFWHQLKPPRTRNHQVVGDTNGIPITFQQETPVFFHGQMSWMVPWNPMKSNEFSSNSMKPHEPWQNPPYFPWFSMIFHETPIFSMIFHGKIPHILALQKAIAFRLGGRRPALPEQRLWGSQQIGGAGAGRRQCWSLAMEDGPFSWFAYWKW